MQISQETVELLTLLHWPRIGPVKVRGIIENRKASESILNAAHRLYPQASAAAQSAAAQDKALAILQRCQNCAIRPVGRCDVDYPSLLATIPDAPPVLFIKGSVVGLSAQGVAVVGTRQASLSGRRLTSTLSEWLATRGYSVVSGLARGVDTVAHETALKRAGTTVAVLAHGLDTVSPASNRALAERILISGGALVSEHPPGVPAHPSAFVRRNRIQSGLSVASLIVESPASGGAMHEARFAREHGRLVMAVLSDSEMKEGDLNEEGALELVQQFGAIGVRTTADLERELKRLQPFREA